MSDGTWVTSTYGRVSFVVTAYDGGQLSVCKKGGGCTTTDYADYFANKWSAVLRNRRKMPTYTRGTYGFHAWIRQSLYENKPYDEFVRQQIAGDLLRPDDAAAVTVKAFVVTPVSAGLLAAVSV